MLVSHTRPWPDSSLLDFLDQGRGHRRAYWANERQHLELAGWGSVWQVSEAGTARFKRVDLAVKALFSNVILDGAQPNPYIGPRIFGGFSFRAGTRDRAETQDVVWADFPDAGFFLPKYLLTRYRESYWLTVSQWTTKPDELGAIQTAIAAEVEDLLWQGTRKQFNSPMVDDPERSVQPICDFYEHIDQQAWLDMTAQAIRSLDDQQLEKVVLARAVDLELAKPPENPAILAQLRARYPDCYRFLYELKPGTAFMGATPELLAEVQDGHINTHALAGSIPRGATWKEDQSFGQALMESPKERHEHQLVVQELRDQLLPLTDKLSVPDQPLIAQFNNIQHLMTPFKGELAKGVGLLDIVEQLHPTPALGGMPKEAALDVIAELEPTPRGWYGAPIGWVGPSGLGQFAIGIRSAVSHEQTFRLYAGAGIVADSQPVQEWHETEIKLKPMLNALGVTS